MTLTNSPTQPTALAWLPPYKVRFSRRARHAQLQIKPHIGLEVVLPMHVSTDLIPDLLKTHAAWLHKQRNVILAAHNSAQTDIAKPTVLSLAALEVSYPIVYQHHTRARASAALCDNTLLVQADLTSQSDCFAVLGHWLHYQGQRHLVPWLDRLSRACELPYRNVRIRSQQQRWGSCSSAHDINLNDKLLFLKPAVVDYVLIHELCHTRHFNHSKAFWALVKRFVPDYDRHKQYLSAADGLIPAWLIHK